MYTTRWVFMGRGILPQPGTYVMRILQSYYEEIDEETFLIIEYELILNYE